MLQFLHQRKSDSASTDPNKPNKNVDNHHAQFDSRKHHTSSEERMIAFQKFIRRYAS